MPTPTPGSVFGGRPQRLLAARPPGDVQPAVAEDRPPADAPFTVRYRAAVKASVVNLNARRIALVLADRADPQTGVIPLHVQVGTRALATYAGMSQTSVRNALTLLVRRGWIRRTDSETPGAVASIQLLMPSQKPPR